MAASDEWDGVTNAGTAVHVVGRDRLAEAGAHTDAAAGGVNSGDAELIKNSFAKNFSRGILRDDDTSRGPS